MKLKIPQLSAGFLLIAFNFAETQATSDVEIPFRLGKGQVLYEIKCASCHGLDLTGTDTGPPFLNPLYRPAHHGDAAFYRAALKGVRAHHWNFGDMPPVPGITEGKLNSILPYIRYYQQQKKLY